MPQGTYKEETLLLSVKDVKFRTNGVGRLFPLIQFNQTIELKKRGIDAIIFDNIGTVLVNKIGKGSRLKVDFDSNNIPSINAKIKDWDRRVEIPTHCEACGRPYQDLKGVIGDKLFGENEKRCSYRYCPATKRGFIYKMFSLAVPTTKPSLVEKFLNEFPVGETTGSLDSIAEFKYVWESIKSRGTQKRSQQWDKAHPELGAQFYNLELEMDKFFHSKEIKRTWFWHICNFPKLSEDVFNEISKLEPKQLVNGETNQLYKNLSPKAKDYIDTNWDFIEWIVRFFDSFGEKEWTK